MATTMPDRLSSVHPQMLRVDSEGHRKPLAGELRSDVARAVERAIVLAGMTKQEAAFAMGYADQGTLSRWCSGVERPLFDKLFGVPALRQPLVLALAELAGIEIETTLRLRRSA